MFVGRREALSAVGAYVNTLQGAFRQKAIGTWGIGKSELTRELKRRVDDDKRATAIRLELGDYTPPATTPDRDPSTKALVQNFDRYCKLLRDLAVAGRSKAFNELEQSVNIALHGISAHQAVVFSPVVNVGADVRFGNDADVASFSYSSSTEDPKLDALVLAEKGKLNEAYVSALAAAGRDYGIVLLLDDFDRIRKHLLAGWLLELLCDPGLDSVVVMVAAREDSADMDDTGRLGRYDLKVFSAVDVEEYMRLRFRSVEPALVEQVLAFSGGLPHAITMAADLIALRSQRGAPANLDGVAREEWSSLTADLLSTIVAEVAHDDDRIILKKGRLARRLDDHVLTTLLHGSASEPGEEAMERVAAVRDRLIHYSFVDTYDDPDLGRSIRFHDHIRHVDAARAPSLHVEAEGVHRALAEHYERQLDAFDETHEVTQTAYACNYKYEDPHWQKLVQEWAHHAGQLREPAGHERARTFLACTFLEAFWWWGCYVKFPFCEGFLDEWDAAHADGDREWSNLLRVILASYPPGYEKDDDPDWPLVEKALVQIRLHTGINGKWALQKPKADASGDESGPARALEPRQRLRALTSLFLAHSYKYRDGYRSLARTFFDDALMWLERGDDQVGVAWARFEVAELTFALGNAATARQELAWATGHALIEDPGDYELLANLHRLDSDLRWAAGEVDEAVDAMAGAAVRAYALQADPHPPDLYTVTFYKEMITRLGNLLGAVPERYGDAKALEACRRAIVAIAPVLLPLPPRQPSDETLRDALASGGETLGLLLAPAPPSLEELYTADSPFVAEVSRAVLVTSGDLEAADKALAAAD